MDANLPSISADLDDRGPTQLLVLPHRSLTRAGLWLFLAAQSVAATGFAGLAAWRGNVFAPVFAVLELGVVAYCLGRVWRRSGIGEMLTLRETELTVARMDAMENAEHFHPYWAHVVLLPGRRLGWPSRLMIRSHGREVEVGAFLNETERDALAQRLEALLARYRNASQR